MSEEKKVETDETTKEENKEIIKKAKKARPKFVASSLDDKTKGISSLIKSLEKFDPEKCVSEEEALNILMKKYQMWLYSLYPADFEDMCWKLSKTSGIKSIVRSYVMEMRGYDRFVGEEANVEEKDEVEPIPEKTQEEAVEDQPNILDII